MLKILLMIIFCLSWGYSAAVQPDWTSLINKRVKFQMNDSEVVAGKVIYCRDSFITVLTYDNILSTIEIEDVESISEIKIACGPVFGLNFGSVGFNADIYNLNMFANTSVLLPVLSQGHLFTFSTGVGKLVNLGASNWKCNFFSCISSASTDILFDWKTAVSAGVGIDFQYTANNRFLCSFKIPVIGYTFFSFMGSEKLEFSYPGTFAENLVAFYACNFLSLPLVAFGASF
jgi:hypothetical protein